VAGPSCSLPCRLELEPSGASATRFGRLRPICRVLPSGAGACATLAPLHLKEISNVIVFISEAEANGSNESRRCIQIRILSRNWRVAIVTINLCSESSDTDFFRRVRSVLCSLHRQRPKLLTSDFFFQNCVGTTDVFDREVFSRFS